MQVNRRKFLGFLSAGAAPATWCAAVETPQRPAVTQRGDPWLEINAANLAWNLRQIQARVGGKPVMAVVKANGYGHGLVPVARALEAAGAKHFLVGKLDEARRLRAAGLRARILNFGPFSEADADDLIRLDITQNVFTEQVEALNRTARRLNRRAHVQVKVDTGLGRFGVPHDRALDFLERVTALPGVAIEGVFTTLREDPEFDPVQLSRLKEICERAARGGRPLGLRHAASSDAILDLPAAYTEFDLVRPGIMLYGLYPSPRAERERRLDLRPVMSLKARVAYVKTLGPGESVSYHRAFTAAAPERVATIAAGYSDGLPRALAGKGSVLVGGRRCPILAISANAAMVRLGDAPAAAGDEVVFLGAQGNETISAGEVAALTGNTVYSVVMGMSALLPVVV